MKILGGRGDWLDTQFWHEHWLFDQASATTMSPWDLANSLTDSDLNAFNSLCPESIIKQDTYLQNMHRWWNKLCQAAQENITVERCLSLLLADLAKVSIFYLAALNLLTAQLGVTYQMKLLQLMRHTSSFMRNRFWWMYVATPLHHHWFQLWLCILPESI